MNSVLTLLASAILALGNPAMAADSDDGSSGMHISDNVPGCEPGLVLVPGKMCSLPDGTLNVYENHYEKEDRLLEWMEEIGLFHTLKPADLDSVSSVACWNGRDTNTKLICHKGWADCVQLSVNEGRRMGKTCTHERGAPLQTGNLRVTPIGNHQWHIDNI